MSLALADVFPQGNPYLQELGVQVLGYGEDRAAMSLLLKPEFMNSWHVAQGGISMTLMDVAMGLAARAGTDARSSATVEMSSSFLQPAGRAGDTLVARGHAYHRSTTLCFCQAELWNGDRLVAKAMGTFKLVRRLDIDKKLGLEQAPEMTAKHPVKIVVGGWDELRAHAQPIRFEVFVAEQKVPPELELDEMDALCLHAVAYDGDGAPLATGRLLPDGHVGRMAVRKAGRGQGVGGAVLRALVEAARRRGDREVILNAQTHAEKFYAAHGFVREGEEFMEAGIAHVAMRLDLA